MFSNDESGLLCRGLQTVDMDQAFWPLCEVDEVTEDGWWGSGLPLRLAMGATSVVWGLATVNPEKCALQRPFSPAMPY